MRSNPAGHFLQHLASLGGNMNEFRCSMGEYGDWVREDVRSKQFQPVILQNPVQTYGRTWQRLARLFVAFFCSIFKANKKSSTASCTPPSPVYPTSNMSSSSVNNTGSHAGENPKNQSERSSENLNFQHFEERWSKARWTM